MTWPGLGGLQPPPGNTPAGAPLVSGVQPGTTSAILTAARVVIFGPGQSGLFLYSPTPGEGNMVASLVAASGVDQFGNIYGQGFNVGVWSAAGAQLQHFGVDLNGKLYVVGPSGATLTFVDTTTGAILSYNSSGQGANNLVTSLAPVAGTDPAGNAYATGLGLHNGILSGTLLLDGSGNMAQTTAFGLTQNISTSSRSALNLHTVTGTSSANLADVTTIYPANDPATGAIYDLEAWGQGTQATGTAADLTFGFSLGSTAGPQVTLGHTGMAAGSTFDWYAKATFKCASPGNLGMWNAVMTGVAQINSGSILPGNAANWTYPFTSCAHTPFSVSTFIPQPAAITAFWSTTTGAPTITAVSGNGPQRIA